MNRATAASLAPPTRHRLRVGLSPHRPRSLRRGTHSVGVLLCKLLAVSICLSGPGPLLAQGAGPIASPRLERILELLKQPGGSVVLSTGSPRGSTVTLAGFSPLQGGVTHPQTDPPRRGGDATMIAFYSLFFGGIAMTIDGFTDDPNSKRKVLGGLALIGGAFAVSCATGAC